MVEYRLSYQSKHVVEGSSSVKTEKDRMVRDGSHKRRKKGKKKEKEKGKRKKKKKKSLLPKTHPMQTFIDDHWSIVVHSCPIHDHSEQWHRQRIVHSDLANPTSYVYVLAHRHRHRKGQLPKIPVHAAS